MKVIHILADYGVELFRVVAGLMTQASRPNFINLFLL
jgi:hypothetical protein